MTAGGPESTTNSYYFTELAQRVIKSLATMGPMGRLYAVDMRLRPTGKSGSLVLPLTEFDRYFASGLAQWWERQSLARVRVVRGEPEFAEEVMRHVHAAMLGQEWSPAVAVEIRQMRKKLEEAATPRSLKRGRGGLMDVEFLVQLLQLKHGREHPAILCPNTWDALDALEAAGLLRPDDANTLRDGYSFLRAVEARLRVVTDRALTELPDDPNDLAKLARRLGFEGQVGASATDLFQDAMERVRKSIKCEYDRLA